ncbi:hypothetical protein MRX96_049849 [Rhipicephalus microplus]
MSGGRLKTERQTDGANAMCDSDVPCCRALIKATRPFPVPPVARTNPSSRGLRKAASATNGKRRRRTTHWTTTEESAKCEVDEKQERERYRNLAMRGRDKKAPPAAGAFFLRRLVVSESYASSHIWGRNLSKLRPQNALPIPLPHDLKVARRPSIY